MSTNAEAVIQHSPPQEASDSLFRAECREGTKNDPEYVVRHGRPLILSSGDIVKLWLRLSQFRVLFAGPEECNFRNFARMLRDEYSLLVNLDDIGVALITDIKPGIEAQIHFSFWDSRLQGREPLIRELVRWVFDVFRVRRAVMPVRSDARAMQAFVQRAGLYIEGVLKNWVKRDDRYYDLHLYGVTNDEADYQWMQGRSWAKPRVRPLEIYEAK